jgi:hypothetical protein
MRRISAYFFSLFIILAPLTARAQDTIMFPLKIKAGFELSGPAIYLSEKKNFSAEGYFSYDLNQRTAIALSGGYLNYNYSQYNYDFRSKGIFFRIGPDFNLRNPQVASDKYWAGIGLKYGLSLFSTETPALREAGYWGTYWSSIPKVSSTAHFLEVSPGIRTELFRNFSIGWSVSLRFLVYSGTGRDNRAIYLPGFGKADSKVSTGFGYFMVWSIPYKKIRYIVKPEEPETEPEPGTQPPAGQQPNGQPSFGQPTYGQPSYGGNGQFR